MDDGIILLTLVLVALAMTMRFLLLKTCNNCGVVLPEDAVICPNCNKDPDYIPV